MDDNVWGTPMTKRKPPYGYIDGCMDGWIDRDYVEYVDCIDKV